MRVFSLAGALMLLCIGLCMSVSAGYGMVPGEARYAWAAMALGAGGFKVLLPVMCQHMRWKEAAPYLAAWVLCWMVDGVFLAQFMASTRGVAVAGIEDQINKRASADLQVSETQSALDVLPRTRPLALIEAESKAAAIAAGVCTRREHTDDCRHVQTLNVELAGARVRQDAETAHKIALAARDALPPAPLAHPEYATVRAMSPVPLSDATLGAVLAVAFALMFDVLPILAVRWTPKPRVPGAQPLPKSSNLPPRELLPALKAARDGRDVPGIHKQRDGGLKITQRDLAHYTGLTIPALKTTLAGLQSSAAVVLETTSHGVIIRAVND